MNMIVRTHPLAEMLSLRDAMNQLVAESVVRPRALARPAQTPLDLYETETEYVAQLAVPGLKPEDFEITLQDGVLRIHGETRAEEQREQGRYHVREQRAGAFDRAIRFHSAVNGEGVAASLAEGILTIRVPKAEEAKPKRITVNVS